MKDAFYRFVFLFFLMNFCLVALAQHPEKKGFLISTITLEKLKNAKTIEEVIVNFPEGYEVVSFHISLAGKDLVKLAEDWEPDYKKNVLNNTFQIVQVGWRVGIEYIQVKRKGTDSKPVHLQPQELTVID